MRLLVVLHARVSSAGDAREAVRALRHAAGIEPSADAAYLLLCSLPAADAPHSPDDAPIVRALQSSVMAMDSRRPGRFMLLVRGRVWSDAARAYLGDEQPSSPAQTGARSLAGQKTAAPFDAASAAPACVSWLPSWRISDAPPAASIRRWPTASLKRLTSRGA